MTDQRESCAAGMHCERALELLPRYLDEELAEPTAARLRQHLMSCTSCRAAASDGRNLQRWFEPVEAPVVPEGFAARVVAQAVQTGAYEGAAEAGGSPDGPDELVAGGRGPMAIGPRGIVDESGEPRRDLGGFLLYATAAAAVVLFALSVALGLDRRPDNDALLAEPLPQVLLELEALNAQGAGEVER